MRLTRRFIAALAVAILVVLSVDSIIQVRNEIALFESDIEKDNRVLARSLAGAAALLWGRGAQAEAVAAVEGAAAGARREARPTVAGQTRVRWVWLDAPAGDPRAPVVPASARPPLDAAGDAATRWRLAGQPEAIYVYARIAGVGPRPAAVEVAEPLTAEQLYVRRSLVQEAVATAVLLAVCMLIAVGLGVVLIARPVRGLVDLARRIGGGDLGARPEVVRRDELGELAEAMTAMSRDLARERDHAEEETRARLATLEQLRHADRLATVGELAAGIAHEVGTPLNVITGHAQLITEEHAAGSETHANAAVVIEQVQRVAGIIRQLLDFARRRVPRKEPHDLALVARQVVSLLEPLAEKRRVRLEVGGGHDVVASIDPAQLEQVLTNLVVNAIHASPAGAAVNVGVELDADPALARVVVSDRGTGIPADVLPRIFEPFFTTKGVGVGTGLGLSVVYGLVREHGGWIDVFSEVGQGSRFAVYLPREQRA